jgi:hypothetical protein
VDRSNEQAKAIGADKDGQNEPHPAGPLPTLVFEIVRYRGYWRTRHRNKHSTPFSDQTAAIVAAKALAKKKRDLGNPVQVSLIRSDGQIVDQPLDGEPHE